MSARLTFLRPDYHLRLTGVMPLPSYLKDSAAALENVINSAKNPYVVGIGGVISTLVKVLHHILDLSDG